PGKQMLFMGGELGQWTEWDHDAAVDWPLQKYPQHNGIQKLIADLNTLYRTTPALHERDCEADGFQWISADDWEKSTYAFVRWNEQRDDWLIIVLNFTPIVRKNYRIGAPRRGFYREAFNSDASKYGGSNTANTEGTYSTPNPMHGFSDSLSLTLPPLAMLALKPVRPT
ncbi:1,4-alpha-glucan branching enzyme, partial [bacterium]|nr:1,4-alpha-glucan branching enzyme [bacterium]